MIDFIYIFTVHYIIYVVLISLTTSEVLNNISFVIEEYRWATSID